MLNFAMEGQILLPKNAPCFRAQFSDAGFSLSAMIAEGKRVAEYFKVTYGVDVASYITDDDEYLAPNVTIPGGIKFTYAVPSETLNLNLVSASNGGDIRFINKPVKTVFYMLLFSQDYISTGTYSGTVKAGYQVANGNYLISTGKEHYEFFGHRNTIFIKYACAPNTLYTGPFLAFNCSVSHEDWGQGEKMGMYVVQSPGVWGGRETLTWGCPPPSSSCPSG